MKFVALFLSKVHTHGLTDRVPKTSTQLDPQRLADFMDVDSLAERIARLRTKPGLADPDRSVLDAFLRGWKARKAGKDPVMDEGDG